MTKPTAMPSSAELFARKGSAKPAGHLISYERRASHSVAAASAKNDNIESMSPAGPGHGDEGPNENAREMANAGGPGSLLTIDFRRSEPSSRSAVPESNPKPSVMPTPSAQRNGRDQKPPARHSPVAQARAPSPDKIAVGPDPLKSDKEPSVSVATAKPSSGDHHSHHGLLLALFTVACLIAGVWFALNHQNLTEGPAPDSATGTALHGDESSNSQSLDTASRSADGNPDKVGTSDGESTQGGATPATSASETHGSVEIEPAIEPSFDLIRIEPNGEAVIAGRAAPYSDLILLDNGEPIGKVTANDAGEWVFIPESPIATGGHQFSLVVNTPQGTVTIPARPLHHGTAPPEAGGEAQISSDQMSAIPLDDKAAAGPDESSDKQIDPPQRTADSPPLPVHKPISQIAAIDGLSVGEKAGYVIQLSSTISLGGAQQELSKLQRIYPALLDGMELEVQKVVVDTLGTRYRVRTGIFDDQAPARALCQKFKRLDHDCLVIQR